VCRPDLFYKRIPSQNTITLACGNYGDQKVCLIAQNKGGCSECTQQKNAVVTDAEIWKHISGTQDMIMVMLCEEGIRFGAADFDKGNVFEDAKAVRDLSVSYGIPCYIARSTKKGYHVYWFFKDFVKPHEFTSYIRHIYEELGFYQRWHATPEIGLPEVFPKQTVFEDKKMGNGIKVPMIEPRMKDGWNCWVDDEGVGFPSNQQWDFLAKTELIEVTKFQAVLTERKVEILQAPASHTRQRARKDENKEEGPASKVRAFGDFWGIVEGCPAMQRHWAKDEKGNYVQDVLEHNAYDASMGFATCTTNGVEEVEKRWPDKNTWYQMKYKEQHDYRPYSCKAMQACNACVVGKDPKYKDHCMQKLEPVEYVNGQKKLNPEGLPKEQWPEPSPIRFATDRHLDADGIIERLSSIYTALKVKSADPKADVFLPNDPNERIRGLMRRAKMLGGGDFDRITAHVTANKWSTAKEMKALGKELTKEVNDQQDATKRKRSRSFRFGTDEFFLQDGKYDRVWRDQKDNRMVEPLTNFYILIREELIALRTADGDDIHNSTTAEDRSLSGTIYIEEDKIQFSNIHYLEFATPDAFFKMLTKHGGTRLWYKRSNFDHIRNCVFAFSQEAKVTRKVTPQIGHHLLKGRNVYIMPSVLIDKDGIRPNEEFQVEPFKDDVSKCLDFKAIDIDAFKDLARHIVADYFTCNNSSLTMTTFAHAMAAAILPQVQAATGYAKSPLLWLGGSFSGGKSFVAEAAQNFYGVFQLFQSASGTAKSKLSTGYNFRHAFMLIDDYKKHLNDPFGKEMPQLIQAAYDRTGRTALQRNGVQREKIDRVRGLLAITAEDAIENESSAISRLLIVDVPFRENRETGGRVKLRRYEYNGFTPYFIQFALGMSTAEIKAMWDGYYEEFFSPVAKTYKSVSPGRVCENLTLNMLAFRVATEMMVARGAIPEVQRDELIRQHKGNLEHIRNGVFASVMDATGAKVFINALKELIQTSSQYEIKNWPDHIFANEGRPARVQIGFWRKKTPDIVYIHPQIAHGQVADMIKKNSNHVQTVNHVARQLFEEGHMPVELVDRSRNRFVTQVRGPSKDLVRVWPIKLESLGLQPPDLSKLPKTFEESDDKQPSLTVVSNKK
jgi:hypothetical protein